MQCPRLMHGCCLLSAQWPCCSSACCTEHAAIGGSQVLSMSQHPSPPCALQCSRPSAIFPLPLQLQGAKRWGLQARSGTPFASQEAAKPLSGQAIPHQPFSFRISPTLWAIPSHQTDSSMGRGYQAGICRQQHCQAYQMIGGSKPPLRPSLFLDAVQWPFCSMYQSRVSSTHWLF